MEVTTTLPTTTTTTTTTTVAMSDSTTPSSGSTTKSAEEINFLVMSEILDMLDAMMDIAEKCPCPAMKRYLLIRTERYRKLNCPPREGLKECMATKWGGVYVFEERKKAIHWCEQKLYLLGKVAEFNSELDNTIHDFYNKYYQKDEYGSEVNSGDDGKRKKREVEEKTTSPKANDSVVEGEFSFSSTDSDGSEVKYHVLTTDSETSAEEEGLMKSYEQDAQPLLADSESDNSELGYVAATQSQSVTTSVGETSVAKRPSEEDEGTLKKKKEKGGEKGVSSSVE